MRFRTFPALGRDVSVLVLGTLRLRDHDMAAADDLLTAWFEAGGNALDCAHEYGGGSSERAVGRWLRASGCREEVVVVTKGCHPYGNGPRLAAADLDGDLGESLSRLQATYVDLYLLHRDDPDAVIGDLLEALEGHRRAGRLRAFGASNWTTARLEEADRYAAANGFAGFSASSPQLSLAVPVRPPYPGAVSASDRDARAWYRAHGLSVFGWSAQAGGFFLDPPPADPALAVYDAPANMERRRRAEVLAARKGCLAHHVALAWTLHQPFPTFAIIGPRSTAELRSSLEALDVELTADEVAWLALEDDR